MPEQIEIPDRIQRLMLYEFILVAQTVRIQYPIVVHHDRVIETAAKSKPLGTHVLDILHETEGPRPAYLLYVGSVFKVDNDPFIGMREYGMSEVDAEVHSKSVVRLEFDPFVALLHFDRVLYADELLGRRLLLDTCRLQQKYETRCEAVHDWNLTCARGDLKISYTQSCHC